MIKALRIVEIMWLVIAAVSAFELIDRWNLDRDKALIFGAFLILSIFMFFFRKRNRQKYEKRRKEQGNQ
jgi:uncharacterized membrane protein YozB (DUF420 family)